MKKANSHVEYQILAQTGGWCMVDYFKLTDGTTLGITDECVVLSDKDWDDEDDGEYLNVIDITHHPRETRDTLIEYPAPTAHCRRIGEDDSDLTGWYIASHEVKSVPPYHSNHFDVIMLRNGIYIGIDERHIVVCEDATCEHVIGTMLRFDI